MHNSNYRIIPLSQHHCYLPTVINALKEQFKHKQGMELKDEDSLETYLKMGTYVMVNSKDDLIGFFSLSRIDGMVFSGILGQVLSFILSWLLGRMLIYDVCILPAYRRKGMGILMMGLIEHYCLHNYPLVRYLELHTTDPNLNQFYSKCGYQQSRMHNEICVFTKII